MSLSKTLEKTKTTNENERENQMKKPFTCLGLAAAMLISVNAASAIAGSANQAINSVTIGDLPAPAFVGKPEITVLDESATAESAFRDISMEVQTDVGTKVAGASEIIAERNVAADLPNLLVVTKNSEVGLGAATMVADMNALNLQAMTRFASPVILG